MTTELRRQDGKSLAFATAAADGATIIVGHPGPDAGEAMPAGSEPHKIVAEPVAAWPEEKVAVTAGALGERQGRGAYVVDTLTVPYDNPFRSVMQLTGMASSPPS